MIVRSSAHVLNIIWILLFNLAHCIPMYREEKPPITQLIEMANIPRLVIGCQDPTENATKGAGTLHANGVSVSMGVLQEECQHLIEGYTILANSKMQRMARQHMRRFGRVSLDVVV